jgi:quinol monooxygenase YgiN
MDILTYENLDVLDQMWESQEAYDKHYQNSESVGLRSKLQDSVIRPIEFKRLKEITG